MKEIKWNDKYSMGSAVIDGHHQDLIACINGLDKEIESGRADLKYLAVLAKKLEDYTAYHFKVEEGYMRRYEYPEYEAHKEEHEAFIEEVRRLKESLANNAEVSSVMMTAYLKNWLIQHILVIDKEYAIWFQEKGIHLD